MEGNAFCIGSQDIEENLAKVNCFLGLNSRNYFFASANSIVSHYHQLQQQLNFKAVYICMIFGCDGC